MGVRRFLGMVYIAFSFIPWILYWILSGFGFGFSVLLALIASIAILVPQIRRREYYLMDEPTSALDPISAARIETLIRRLAEDYTIIIVTHSMQQAARISDYVAFLYMGELIEYGPTKDIFENPRSELTERYITGKFG